MQRAGLTLASILVLWAVAAQPARAQIAGMPLWNSPRGGMRFMFAGDLGFPNASGGKGTTYAARAAAGFQALTVSATVGVHHPPAPGADLTEYGATAAYRIIGGALIPIAVNLQGGIANLSDSGVSRTRFTGAVGFAVDLPIPYLSVEPWVAPGLRVNRSGSQGALPARSTTQFGIAGGLTFGFGLFGLHTAIDYEKLPAGGGHMTTLGIGVHVDIRPSLGL